MPHHSINKLWLPVIAPLHLLLACSMAAIIAMVVTIWLSAQSPWIGIEWTISEQKEGITVTAVDKNSLRNKLKPGDRLIAFESYNGQRISLNKVALLEDPDFSPTYSDYNLFFEYQRKWYDIFSEDTVIAVLDNGNRIPLEVSKRTPIFNLPATFWFVNLFGITAFIIGVGVWCYRRGEIASRLFVLSGFGYMVAVFCASIYLAREFVMNPDDFYILSAINHLGNMLFGYSALGLLWLSPQKISSFPVVKLIYLSMLLIWLNETFQIYEWPLHTYYLQFNFPFVFAILFAILQWKKSKVQPLERAALKWFLLSVSLSVGLTMLFFFTPVVIHTSPLVSIFTANAIIFTMYIGLALGVTRYRLFELEHWWVESWVWFGGGLFIILLEVALAYALNLNPITALGLAIVLGGWVYFPVRQWLWGKFIHSPKQTLDQYLPELMNMFNISTSVNELSGQWNILLTKIFNPLNVTENNQILKNTKIEDNGLMLIVPTLCGQSVLELSCGNRGARLFVTDDIKLADAILNLARKSASLREAQQKGADNERDRIMRDLHDDVGAKLLTLVHKTESKENSEIASSALQTLRDTIYCLNNKVAISIHDALADWRSEIQERLEIVKVTLDWQQSDELISSVLSPREQINLGRILHETITNTLRHAKADNIKITIKEDRDQFLISICDNGYCSDIKNWKEGTGIENIRMRVNELGGRVIWSSNSNNTNKWRTGTLVDLRFPCFSQT